MRAFECDRTSAFGGVVAVNRPLDRTTAEHIVQIVTHVVIAPEILDESVEVLARRKGMIVLARPTTATRPLSTIDVRSVPGGFLVQDWDRAGFDRAACASPRGARRPKPSGSSSGCAWIAVKHVKSNAIVLFKAIAPRLGSAQVRCRGSKLFRLRFVAPATGPAAR